MIETVANSLRRHFTSVRTISRETVQSISDVAPNSSTNQPLDL